MGASLGLSGAMETIATRWPTSAAAPAAEKLAGQAQAAIFLRNVCGSTSSVSHVLHVQVKWNSKLADEFHMLSAMGLNPC